MAQIGQQSLCLSHQQSSGSNKFNIPDSTPSSKPSKSCPGSLFFEEFVFMFALWEHDYLIHKLFRHVQAFFYGTYAQFRP